MHSRSSAGLLLALAAAVATALGACSSGVHFTTELDAPGTLAPGNPVTYQGGQIGKVTSISPASLGGSEVGFDVEQAAANEVHQDSLVVLQSGGDSSWLDLRNPNVYSPVAPPGSRIQGADSEAQARMMLASRGLGALLGGLAQFLASSGAAGAASSGSSALDALTRELAAIQRNMAANASANQAAARAQLDRLVAQGQALERELIRQGRTAEAQRLRRQIEGLVRSLSPAPRGSSGTLVTPKVYP
jgi:ABC-type transporter Mla subunit MlaD